ncbi:CoA binding domain protein [Candidatus Tiddalikarchaeum anstoanum]|nr:CoA binding domain protein [Candidatus Tiddalikarchaeum anstoanum]
MNIAIIGASIDRERMSNKAVRAYLSKGYTVFPVNPNYEKVEGLKTYKALSDIKEKIDIISVYVNPDIGIKIANEIISKKPVKVYLNPGSERDDIVKKLENNHINVLQTCSIRAIGIDPDKM